MDPGHVNVDSHVDVDHAHVNAAHCKRGKKSRLTWLHVESGELREADIEYKETWKVWPIAEIRKHNSRDDFWTVIKKISQFVLVVEI